MGAVGGYWGGDDGGGDVGNDGDVGMMEMGSVTS